ncbi:hypothetical protein Trydic_g22194 [Trypoxylus dichotomus]
MQRILSVETSRNATPTSEFVSKRFCFSILFSIAFLFLLAGYLLGRYTTDRAILLKKAYLQQKFALDEKNFVELMKNISISIRNINNFTIIIQTESVDTREVYEQLLCNDHKAFLPSYGEFTKELPFKINKMLTIHLDSLANCFTSIDNLLRNISSTNN